MRTAILFVVAVLLATHGCTGHNTAVPATQAVEATVTEGPWAECAPIVEWLRKNLGDPTTLEIVEWESRTPQPEYQRITVFVRYRTKNRNGALSVWRRSFRVHDDGKITASEPREMR